MRQTSIIATLIAALTVLLFSAPVLVTAQNKPNMGQSESKDKPNYQKSEDKGQGKGKGQDKDKDKGKEKDKEKKEKDEDDDKREKDEKENGAQPGKANGKDKELPGNGNAYGRNKEGLSGKDFGQRRAEEAKGKSVQNLDTSKVKMQTTQTTIDRSKDKIATAKTKIETDYKTGKVTLDAYNKAKATLEAAEQKLRTLESDAIKLKEKIANTKIEIK